MIPFRRCLRLIVLLVFLPMCLGACKCANGSWCMCGICEVSGSSVPTSFLAHSCPNVVTLYLEKRSLTSVHSQAFHGLASLKYIYLQDNKVKILDENVFSNNTVLKILNVAGNPLRELRIWSASLLLLSAERCNLSDDNASFEHLPALKTLLLRHNTMVDAPHGLPPTLEVLDLAYNRLKKLDQRSLLSLTSLRELMLDGNPLTLVAPVLPSLKVLMLRDCHLTSETLFLVHLPLLQELEAAGNDLRRVPRWLPTSLQKLNLSRNALAEADRRGAFLGFSNLKLDISQNQLSDAQVKALCSGANICFSNSQAQVIVAKSLDLRDVVVIGLAALVVLITVTFICAVLLWHCERRRPRRSYMERARCAWRNSDTTYLVPSLHKDKAEQHTYIELE